MAISMLAQNGYTDLGLPSGTKWKNYNATGFYTYDEAISQFGNRLPSMDQWYELKAECQWTWIGNEFKVTGPNGQSITLPTPGFCNCSGNMYNVGSFGRYWSSMPDGPEGALFFYFSSDQIGYNECPRCQGLSVRLVQK